MPEFDISFPEHRRFDDRQLRVEDDGRDFERFVYEALALLVDADTLRPGFGRGRDGAIDHIVEGVNQRIIVECKFIGRHATNTPQDRWGEVRRHLNDNLPKLAAKDPISRRGSPYAPWLDAEHRITGYLFCVSFAFSHAEERGAFEKQIADDFLKLSRIEPHSQLSHLRDVHIQVRGWDDFHGELRRRFPLRYRWFGDLPRGVVPIRDRKYESRSFRRFLFEDALPFFSREKFTAEGEGQQITREEQFVSNLAAERGDEALLLSGAGGVGKTRLSLELCDRLSKRGWLALRLTDNATSASLVDLVKSHAEPAQIILLSDYAERADDLSAIAEEVSLINDGNSHRVRLIATCRMSAFSSVQDALASLTPREVTLGTPRASEPSETAFTEWVVRQILEFGRLPGTEQVARVCHGLPILAAFALFLYQRDPAQFTEQFGSLAGIRDFRDWVKRRLDVALRSRHSGHDQREVLQHIALLSLRLPMSRRESDDIADRSPLDGSLLEMLRTDRWVEDVDGRVVATHDVFADAMVAHYVFETRAVANMRLEELLRAATEQGFLDSAFFVIDRLAGHPDFESIDGTAIVRALINRAPTRVITAHERLLRGRLLPDRGKVELLAEFPDLHAAVSKNPNCDVAVAHIADTLARLRRNDPSTNADFVAKATEVIAPLLATSLANPHPSNMNLRRAFALLPETYRSAVLGSIANEPTASQTHYLLVAWLQAGLPIEGISSAAKIWLSVNAARNIKASFIVRAWLEAGGSREFIDDDVLYWIPVFGATENAQFVYVAWLKAGGNREVIDDAVLKWIGAFGGTEGAPFVYRSWLEAGGNRKVIDDQVLKWIGAFGVTENARFVYRSWLAAGGNRELIDDAVLKWIGTFGTTEDARFVYKAWLEAGGNRELIDDDVLKWIGDFGTTEAAQFVYWPWLAAGGSFESIAHKCLEWFDKYRTKIDAVFVLKYIVRQKDLPSDAIRNAILWCARFSDHEESIWRITSLLGRYSRASEAVAIVRAFVICVRSLDLQRLGQERSSNEKDHNANLLSHLILLSVNRALSVRGLDEVDRGDLLDIHKRLLIQSFVYATALVEGPARALPSLILHVAQLIRDGSVSPDRDPAALQRFADWMRAWPDDARNDLELAVASLRRVAPSDIWEGIPPSRPSRAD